MPELQLQNLDQTLCSKSEQNLSLMTNPKLPNLQQTVANMTLKQQEKVSSVSKFISSFHPPRHPSPFYWQLSFLHH